MLNQYKLPIATSVASALLLSACGGGGNSSFTGESGSSFVVDNSKIALEPLNLRPPTINEFLLQKWNNRENSGMMDLGQQLSPSVTSIDLDENSKITAYDKVSFEQPGVVSEICTWDGNDSDDPQCWDGGVLGALRDRLNEANTNFTTAQDNLNQAQTALNTILANPASTAQEQSAARAAVAAAQAALDTARAARETARQNFSTPGPDGQREQRIPPDGVVVMRDVNGVIHNIFYNGTIDLGFLKSVQVEKLIASPDAGITKIEKIRLTDKNGKKYLEPYGGSIGREFNQVVVFDRNFVPEDSSKAVPEELQYLDAYFRSPATSGWSFQTFGNYKSQYLDNRRDLIVGYQSIGVPTSINSFGEEGKLPDKKFAEYRGIAHAYINSDKYANNNTQVTMHNYIRADFSNRELSYQMLKDKNGNTIDAIMHTFEGPNNTHVIEVRPDLNITGSAHWDKGVPRFRGTVQTAGGLTGKMDGQFYGPSAAEVGGVFGIEGVIDGAEAHYVGGFGAKRN